MKVRVIILFLLSATISCNILQAQSNSEFEKPTQVNEELKVKKPYPIVDMMPKFPGGHLKLQEFIEQNIRYPEESEILEHENKSGSVVVRFIVEETGEILTTSVMKGLNQACNREAVRLVKSMPSWEPGKHGGETVRVYYQLSLPF